MERVSVVHGRKPVILVAPHGYDDSYTDIMTEHAAITCAGNAVINRGWQRSKTVDVLNDLANCNNINHATHNVVKDEFFNPIAHMERRLTAKHRDIYVFHIHGCGNDIRKQTGISDLSVIIGYGKGEKGKSRPTSNSMTRNMMSYLMDTDRSPAGSVWKTAIAEAGSKFAGWDANNLLQMWRSSHQVMGVMGVNALQLEFVTATRKNKKEAEVSGVRLGNIINKFLMSQNIGATVSANFSPTTITI